MKRNLLVVTVMGLLLVGCDQKASTEAVQPEQAESAIVAAIQDQAEVIADAHNARNALDWNGTYNGILPCADCSGIETQLMLKQDGSYMLTETYQGKEGGDVERSGQLEWNAAGNTVTLLNDNGSSIQYFVGERRLFRLDREGKRITGDLAENYILQKQ
ncbi:hypothetical protein C9J12_09835 [Photobacterium frigidiphilum]|uniref:Copper resistance protein NlpE n=1 Tax=Photobacterium frigidiphilum TaxID=264736 RepID=A0A2T3JII3_9GAMM|nr:copper resistance protein NlpE [Photobacterium frigidiphilum]PSU48801.1 hypothetical protein C9J12_09835 [Photobacterium frigidiphilum]